ncbi:hypothetical protein MASR2M12_17610 [Bacteroidales bacterium]
MSKIIALFGIISCSVLVLSAQTREDFSSLRIRVSGWPGYTSKNQGKITGYLKGEVSYRMNPFFEAGVSAGVFQSYKFQSDNAGNIISDKHYLMHFGPHVNLHIIPFFVDHHKLRFDFYLAGKAGWIPYFSLNENMKFTTYYFLGAGTNYFITKNIGIFAEYGLYKEGIRTGNSNKSSKFRSGLVFQFF